LPRKEDIEAAIAALTSPDRATIAVRLLITMFPEGRVCRRSLVALSTAAGLPRNATARWLTALINVGLLSKEAGRGSGAITYRLHLPTRRRS
jgi:DNA-binding IclR family transcriptional regulator